MHYRLAGQFPLASHIIIIIREYKTMKAQYIYKSAFGDSLLTITGKSAARGRDSVHNLRWERTLYIDRIDELNRNVRNLRRANAVMRRHACKEGERMLAEMADMRRDYDTALSIADKDKQALLDKVESLQAENKILCAEIARLQAELADMRDFANRCFMASLKNAVALADERKRGE